MSVASFLLSTMKKNSLSEAFDVKVLGYSDSSKNFYVSVGGINYQYSPKDENTDMISVLKNFYRKAGNPVKALAELKSYANSKKVNSIPKGLTVINSVKDIDKLNSIPDTQPSEKSIEKSLGNDQEDKLYQEDSDKEENSEDDKKNMEK